MYVIEAASALKDKRQVVPLWDQGLTDAASNDKKYDWYHLQNPFGPGTLLLLTDQAKAGARIGTVGLGVRQWRIHGRLRRVGLFSNLVVAPEYRSLGPALMLLKGIVQAGADEYAFLYGFPNRQAAAVYRRAGYRVLGEMGRYARPLDTRRYLRQHMPDWLGRCVAPALNMALKLRTYVRNAPVLWRRRGLREVWLEGPNRQFDALWRSGQRDGMMCCRRDETFLRWRFFHPLLDKNYTIYAVYNADQSALLGYVVFEPTATGVFVADFFAGNHLNLTAVLYHFASAMARRGVGSIALEFFGDAQIRRVLAALGFVLRESRPLYYCAGDGLQPQITNANWYITAADEDL